MDDLFARTGVVVVVGSDGMGKRYALSLFS